MDFTTYEWQTGNIRKQILYPWFPPIESVHKYSILDVDNLLEKKDNNLLCRTSECIYL